MEKKITQDVNIDRLNALVSALALLVGALAAHHPERKRVLQTLRRADGEAEFDETALLLPASAESVRWARKTLGGWLDIAEL